MLNFARLWCLWTLAACAPHAPAVPPPEPMVTVRSGPAVGGGLFLQGFDAQWEALPHRLSRIAFGAHGAIGEDAALEGLLDAEVRGGTWASGAVGTDTPRLSVRYGGVASDDVRFVPGSADVALQGRIGRGGEPDVPAEATVDIAVRLPPDAPRDAVLVWLTGFQMDTAPSHPEGYTLHALAVRLGAPTLDGDEVRFTATVRLQAAPVIDRRQNLAEYGSRARVDYAVVAASGAATRFSSRSSVGRGSIANPTRSADPARLPVTVAGAPGWPVGIAGMSGFDIDLLVDGPTDGRYLRSLTVGLEDARYDGARGTLDALVALRFTNTGKLPRPVRVDAVADFTLLQLDEDADLRAGRWSPAADGQAHAVAYPTLEAMDGKAGEAWKFGWEELAEAP